MLRGENIICISSIDWDFLWQGHQEIMSTFAKNGNTVLFIENTGVRAPKIRDISRIKRRLINYFRGIKGIRKEENNLYVYSPLVLPFPYLRVARPVNRYLLFSVLEKWMKVMDFAEPIIWTFLPTGITLDIVDHMNKKLLLYYCIDNFSVSSPAAGKIKPTENRLLKKADIVFVTSQSLYDMCAQHCKNVTFFPFGVSLDNFVRAREALDAPVPEDLEKIKGIVIGYVGGIHKWIDFNIIRSLAGNYPQYSFVFVGPLQTDVSFLKELKNVFFLGNKNHEELPRYIKNFQVGIIPYVITDYTKNVYPTKLNEYLSMGKPVIATDLPEIAMFNKRHSDTVYIGRNPMEFGQAIEKAIKDDSESLREKRIKIAAQNSWGNRIEDMSGLIIKAIEKKMMDKDAAWKEQLLLLCRAANRKICKGALTFLFLYLIFFYTPLIWVLGEPLKISQVPQKTDAIVVFGGGVGETGSPGKSTIERARFAAELYRQGFASCIIFSSGYTYIYNDAENMKMFAISMGVPAEDIILEPKANSTYENVRFSYEILKHRGLKSILLVSAPYNMRRISLVFNKIAKDVMIRYIPVSKSQFYNKSGRVRFEQINAIFHEYMGIIYYFLKGYA